MMSIGTLLAYSLVAISVLILRYLSHLNYIPLYLFYHNLNRYQTENFTNERKLINSDDQEDKVPLMKLLFKRNNNATKRTSRLVSILTVICSKNNCNFKSKINLILISNY